MLLFSSYHLQFMGRTRSLIMRTGNFNLEVGIGSYGASAFSPVSDSSFATAAISKSTQSAGGLVLSSILHFSYKYIFRPWLACSNTKPEIPDPDVLEAQTFCLPFCKGPIGPWAPDYPRNVSDVDQNRFNPHPGLSPPPPPITP
jgi:hypothetical protein